MTNISNSQYCQLFVKDELECISIKHPNFVAEICLQGAQLTQFTHQQTGDFVWLSPEAEYKQGQSLRGGVPICWPWFGVLNKNPDSVIKGVNGEQGSHGFARIQKWVILHIQESASAITIEMGLKDNSHTRAIWPYAFDLRCRFHFSDELSIELVNQNQDDQAFTFSQALHSYLPVQNIDNVRIQGAQSNQYIDALDNWASKTQDGPIIFSEEVDRIYLGDIHYRLTDASNTFSLISNSQSSVVWNPWIAKSKTLSQFPDDAYQSMVCIENGNILQDVVTLKPNESHTLRMTLKKENSA